MHSENIYTKIRFSPSKYTWQIQGILDYLDMMICEEDLEETISAVNQYPHIPEAQLALTELYGEIDQPLKYHTGLERLRNEYPNHIEIKAAWARSKYYDFSKEDHRRGFRELFASEIECLIEDKALPEVISDREMRILLLSLTEYFVATEDKKSYHKLYTIADQMDQDEIREIIACHIRGKDLPMGGPSFEIQTAIEDWVAQNLEVIGVEAIRSQPHNDLFYTLLNKPAGTLNANEIGGLSALSNEIEIEQDIIWLLCQGLKRSWNTAGECSQDYFIHALFLTAHFDLKAVAKILLQILTGIPEQISDRMVGDVGDAILGPAIQKLGMSDLAGFYEMLIFNEKDLYDDEDEEFEIISEYDIINNFWYSKSMIIHALAALAALDYPQKEEAISLLRRLWDHYDEHDPELLGWLGYSIVHFNVKGFEQLIAKAYQENKIDTYTHGTFEEFMVPETEHKSYPQFSELRAYYEDLGKIEARFENGKKISIEKEIDNTLKGAQIKTKIFHQEIQESLHWEDLAEDQDRAYSSGLVKHDPKEASFFQDKPMVKKGPKVGRNDPCPCGSGKKYKKCCL